VRKWSCNSDHLALLNFKNYEINGRFVSNLEPQFKIELGRTKEHKKKNTIRGKKIEKR